MKKQLKGFMVFVRQQGVVGLAVGLVLGSSIKSLVDSIVNNIVNPVIGFMLGGTDLSKKFWCINTETIDGVTVCTNRIGYGEVISNIISFVAIAALVYFVVMGLKLDRLDIDKEEPTPSKRNNNKK